MTCLLEHKSKIKINPVLERLNICHFNSFCEKFIKHDFITFSDNILQYINPY